jgi:hypothetical protein
VIGWLEGFGARAAVLEREFATGMILPAVFVIITGRCRALRLSSSGNPDLLQIDGLVAAVLVELGAPYLVRALMLGWTEADGRPQPHVEITHGF